MVPFYISIAMLTLWFKNNRQTLIYHTREGENIDCNVTPFNWKKWIKFSVKLCGKANARCKMHFYIISVGDWLGTYWDSLALSSKFGTELFSSSLTRWGRVSWWTFMKSLLDLTQRSSIARGLAFYYTLRMNALPPQRTNALPHRAKNWSLG